MAADYRTADLDPPTRALCDYAVKVTIEPWAVCDADLDRLRDHGFDDTAILEATHVIGYFNHINRMADALDVDLEPEMSPHPDKGEQQPNPYRHSPGPAPGDAVTDRGVGRFQHQIAAIYGERDRARGIPRNFMWFTEEVGELSRALSRETPERRGQEFADVLAWLCTLADQAGVDLGAVAWQRYGSGCPRCSSTPCSCPERGTPDSA